jgi:hypothetical protein
MSTPDTQTEHVTWNRIEIGEPLVPGAYLITRTNERGRPQVHIAGYSQGIWSIGKDDKGKPLNAKAHELNIVAWAEILEGFKI